MMKYFIYLIVILYLFIGGSAWSFEPSKYVSSESLVYIEAPSYKQMFRNAKKFYFNFRKKDAEAEWFFLTGMLGKSFGFNIFQLKFILSLGMDINKPFALSIDPDPKYPKKWEFSFVLPAKNTEKFYFRLKKYFQQRNNKDSKKKITQVKEIKKNILFSVKLKNRLLYIRKFKNHLFITNKSKVALKSNELPADTVHKEKYYTEPNKKYLFSKKNKDTIFNIYANPKKLYKLTRNKRLQILSGYLNPEAFSLKKKDKNKISLKKIKQNLISVAGIFSVSKKKASLYLNTFFSKNYLQNKVILFPFSISNKSDGHQFNLGNLKIDAFQKKSVLYASQVFHPGTLLNVLTRFRFFTKREISNFQRLFKMNFSTKLNSLFNKNMSLLIEELPRNLDFRNPNAWSAHVSFHTKQDKSKIKEFTQLYIELLKKKNQTIRLKKISADFWEIGYQRQSIKSTSKQKLQKNNTYYYILFDKNEIVISTSKKMQKWTKSSAPSKKNKMLLSGKVNFLLHLDLKKLFLYAIKNRLDALLGNIVYYVEHLDKLKIKSSYTNSSYILKADLNLN